MNKFKRIRIPEEGHPAVIFLFSEINRQQCDLETMEARSGVNRSTIRSWRTRVNPQVGNLEACLNVLGYRLALKRLGGE